MGLNTRHAIGNGDRGQATAVSERTTPYRGHVILSLYTFVICYSVRTKYIIAIL